MPRVGICAGHMIDRPDRGPARFPESSRLVFRRRSERGSTAKTSELVSARGACGADLIFLEALIERGGVSHVILPFDQKVFRETSVAFAGETWVERFKRVLARSVVQTVSDRPLKFGEVAYDHANQIIHGLAVIHAQRLSTTLRRLVVWDGQEAVGSGGTGDVVCHWRRLSDRIDVIQVPHVQPARPVDQVVPAIPSHSSVQIRAQEHEIKGFGVRVVAVLFADVVGFSKMSEDQMPVFIDEFLQVVADILDSGLFRTVKKNTWGDGLFIAFETVGDAGRFALDLCEYVKTAEWAKKGLPENFGLRTALHAGPVYLCTDPITGLPNCIGTQVSHAAQSSPLLRSTRCIPARRSPRSPSARE